MISTFSLNRHAPRCQQLRLVHFVRLFRVQIYLQDVGNIIINTVVRDDFRHKLVAVLHPLESPCRQWLAHRPATEVAGIKVENVCVGLGWTTAHLASVVIKIMFTFAVHPTSNHTGISVVYTCIKKLKGSLK